MPSASRSLTCLHLFMMVGMAVMNMVHFQPDLPNDAHHQHIERDAQQRCNPPSYRVPGGVRCSVFKGEAGFDLAFDVGSLGHSSILVLSKSLIFLRLSFTHERQDHK